MEIAPNWRKLRVKMPVLALCAIMSLMGTRRYRLTQQTQDKDKPQITQFCGHAPYTSKQS
jgi:hypothetical protein